MKLIVISKSKSFTGEIGQIIKLFECGLETFHLRKPNMSTKDMRELLNKIPPHFRNRIIIHSHHKLARKFNLKGIHLTSIHKKRKFSTWFCIKITKAKNPATTISTSFHKLAHVYDNGNIYDYAFIGTLFDRLSGQFNAGYNETSVRAAISKSTVPLIARGGINIQQLTVCKELGFSGVAFGSYIWDSADPSATFCEVVEYCRKNNIPIS